MRPRNFLEETRKPVREWMGEFVKKNTERGARSCGVELQWGVRVDGGWSVRLIMAWHGMA